jgi:anti-sigma regulatory factor (Ser/Thr protein kinase)
MRKHPRTRLNAIHHRAGAKGDHMTTYQGTFGGRAEEAARVRREIATFLNGCPATTDLVLIAHELAANAILHSRSRGGSFAIRCHLTPDDARIEVEDMGGPWRPRDGGDRPHGLDIVQALTGPSGWGTHPTGTGHRLTWAQLSW